MNICKDCRIPVALAVFAVFVSGCAKSAETTEKEALEFPKTEEVAKGDTDAKEPVSQADEKASSDAVQLPAPYSSFDKDTVLVEVVGQKLTFGEALDNIKKVLMTRGVPEDQAPELCKSLAPQAVPQMAEQFVTLNLLKNEAKTKDFTASEADVDDMLAKMAQQLPPGLTLSNAFAMNGLTVDSVRKELRDAIPVNKMLEKMTAEVDVSEKDVADFYEKNIAQFTTEPKVRASHILIKVEKDAKEEDKIAAKVKLAKIRQEILDGADFAAMAATNSACPSKEQGGDLGFFGKGQMVPEFEKAAFSLSPDDISDVIETQFGYHIIKVTDRKDGGTTPLADVSADIKQHLTNMKKNEILEGHVKELRSNAKITVAPGLELFVEPPVAEPASSVSVESEPVAVPAPADEAAEKTEPAAAEAAEPAAAK